MHDSFGRRIHYLRLSITHACAMRCVYCRPVTDSNHCGPLMMSPAEIQTLVRYLAEQHGLRKVRLTGGEPTSRGDLLEIVRRLGAIEQIRDLAMTTNGLTLARDAEPFAAAGLRRVNVSLDSLDAERFRRITGVNGLSRVIDGLDAALRAGLLPIKLNTVVVRGENDAELPELLRFAAARNIEIRFIELMPMGPLADQWVKRYVPESEMRRTLDADVVSWHPRRHGSASARSYEAMLPTGQLARVGFITAMSCPFCDACDRIRIGADGTYYPCLMDKPAGTILPALRPYFDPAALDRVLKNGLSQKQELHPAVGVGVMTHIGG